MDENHIDNLFDEAMSRTRKSLPAADPYGLGPLASDHFLLSKSWTFFKEKMKILEGQYKQMLAAKDEKVVSLQSQLEKLLKDDVKVTAENKENEKAEYAYLSTRAHDFIGFQKDQEELKKAWDEERLALEEQVQTREFEIQQNKAEIAQMQGVFSAREKELIKKLSVITEEREKSTETMVQQASSHAQAIVDQQSEVKRRDNKIDLMRAEINRRDEVIRQHEEALASQKKELEKRETNSLGLQNEIDKLKNDAAHLAEKYALLAEEKNIIKTNWEKEQSQWRELWDRERSLWEKRENSSRRGS